MSCCDCHRRLNHYNNKLQQLLDKLKQQLPTNLLDTVTTNANRRADKTSDQTRNKHQQKLTRLQHNKDKRRQRTDDNWVRNISSRPLDKTETQVLSYRLKHSVTTKRIPTESIVSSVEAVLSRQRDLSEPAKDNIRSRIASTIQLASITDSNLTKDEQQAPKRLKNSPTKDVLLLLWKRLTTMTKGTHLLTTNKLDGAAARPDWVTKKVARIVSDVRRPPTITTDRQENSNIFNRSLVCVYFS